jgi:type VI secretion system Hcp family effector
MLLDAYLKFEGGAQPIKGEATETDRTDAIEILSFEQLIEPQHALTSDGTAHAVAMTQLGPLRMIKPLDRASVFIYRAACYNDTYPKAVLSLYQPKADGSGKVCYMQITCEHATIGEIHIIGDPRLHTWEDGKFLPASASEFLSMGPLEAFDLHFRKIEWLYKGADGSANATASFARRQGT